MNLDKDLTKQQEKKDVFATPTEMREKTSNRTPSLTGGGVHFPAGAGYHAINALERETFYVRDFLQDLINGIDDHPYEPFIFES